MTGTEIPMSTIRNLLEYGTDKLKTFETSHLDCEVLLSYVLQKPREYLLTHLDDIIKEEQDKQFHDLIARRAKYEPIAYLTKRKEFYGRNFYIDERVHIPRPSTEDMIDIIIRLLGGCAEEAQKTIPRDFSGSVADIGTGSGCIAVTLALEFPNAKIITTDISQDALSVARQNARALGADKIEFLRGDLLAPLPAPVDIIVSNPPYGWPKVVRSFSEGRTKAWTNDEEVFFQPKISYESGTDGLDVIKRLLDQLPHYLKDNGQAFIEFDPRQAAQIKDLAKIAGFDCKIKKDTAGFDRLAHLTKINSTI